MAEPYTGTCTECGAQFPCRLIHNGFNETAYAYCERCGATGFIDAWRSDIPPTANFKAHGPISAETEVLIAPCSCGGRFRANAEPRCVSCHAPLSAQAATSWLEAQAPGTKDGWRWQRSWSGLYALVVAGRSVQLVWAES
jgi:hypothetical protein